MSDDSKVKLHALPPSSNSAVLRTFLLASEIPFEELNAWGQTRTPEYIAKFPSNLTPAIEHGDYCLAESVSCMRYLCKAFPDKAGKFYTDDAKLAGKIDMLCDMINTTICVLIPKAVYPTLGFPAYPGDVGQLEETKAHTAVSQKSAGDALLEYLDTKIVGIYLSKTKYLLTDDAPTIADFRLAPMLSQVKCQCAKLPDRITGYLATMDEVPGFKDGTKPADDFNKQHWKDQEC